MGEGAGVSPGMVALRKESVDRNDQIMQGDPAVFVSLSARRAWIEIRGCKLNVVVRKLSLSARRAWIEITQFVPITTSDVCRSPQGERG